MKIMRPVTDVLVASGTILFALILLLRVTAPRAGPIEFQWATPTLSSPGSSPVLNASQPPEALRVNSDGFAWCAYYPWKQEAAPPERLYVPLGKPDSPYYADWTNIPNPELQEFRKRHPPLRRIWQYGPIWSDERLIDRSEPTGDSYVLVITGAERSWHLPHWLLMVLTGSIPAVWLASVFRQRFRKGTARCRPCPSCGKSVRASSSKCPHCGISSRPAIKGVRGRMYDLIVIGSLLICLVALAAWVASVRWPALITWSSSSGETFPPTAEGDCFVVLAQWNMGVSDGGLCVAQTHWAEFWSDAYGARDMDGLAYYESVTEWPYAIRRAKVDAIRDYKQKTADMVRMFNVPTSPPAKWWEPLGITASSDKYDELRPLNTCRGIRLPLWMIALVLILLPGHWLTRATIARRRWKQGHCVVCGYDLRGSTSRCPECGTPIAPEASS